MNANTGQALTMASKKTIMKKFVLLLFTAAAISFCACNNGADKKKEAGSKNDSLQSRITEKPWGIHNNENIIEYTLTNSQGMQVSILNYGGTVTKIITPDKEGKPGDVVLGFESLEGYLQPANPYFGSLVGRYANRIANASFTLDGATYQLAKNNNGNSLHGGNKGFDKVTWSVEKMPGDSSLKFSYHSKDGEEGYPGNLNAEVIYRLTADNTLVLEYTATTDKATPVNLTSHCYFNLSAGRDSTILNHQLEIAGDKYTPVNDKLIPTGQIAGVKGTPMDFTKAKMIGKDIQQVTGGYDHNWVLNKQLNTPEKVVSLYDSVSGRYMEVFTTEPGLQFYSGNFLDGTLSHTKNGQKYVKYAALCLEAQHYPDSPNQPSFPTTILKPGETYKQTTVHKFSVK